jgi:maltodextrin utilization protein YvdJ
MKQFVAILYSNKAIHSFKRMNGLLVFLLFIANVLMISAPLIRERSLVTGPEIIERFPGVDEALIEAFANAGCTISDRLVCETPKVVAAGEYEVGFLIAPTSESYVFFDTNQVVIQTSQNFFFGGYLFAEGIELSSITTPSQVADLVYGFATSGAGFDFSLILIGQLIQTTLYVSSLSLMLLISNYRAKEKKITYKESLRVTILAMAGPALVGGFFGFIEPTLSGVVFLTIYSLRMMYLYYGLFMKTNVNTVS